VADQRNSARQWAIIALIVCAAAALLIAIRYRPQTREHEPSPQQTTVGHAEGEQGTVAAGAHVEEPPDCLKQPVKGVDNADAAHERDQTPSKEPPAGVNLLPPARIRAVALHFARRRWQGCKVGPGSLAYAPDGVPEVSFHVVYKRGVAEVPLEEIAARVAALRAERLDLEQQLARAPADQAAELRARIAQLWKRIRGAESYATIVAGANDGREPFIASFGGLPPQLYLIDDAKDLRRKQLGGADPGEPRIVWVPPAYVAFEFPPAAGQPAACFAARGTELHEISLAGWQRTPLPEEIAKLRAAKWQALAAPGHD